MYMEYVKQYAFSSPIAFVVCVSVGTPLPFVISGFLSAIFSNWNYYIVTSNNVW